MEINIQEIIQEEIIKVKKEITTYWYNLYNLFNENIQQTLKQIQQEKNEIIEIKNEIFEFCKNNEIKINKNLNDKIINDEEIKQKEE